MKMEFDVWENARGEVHLVCDDRRLEKPINIRAVEGLASTNVLRTALYDEKKSKKAEPPKKYLYPGGPELVGLDE